MADAVKIGAAIKMLRLRLGYTQHELANCLNVTDKAVSKWERGLSIPDISILTGLCDLLNCDVDNLLEGNVTYLEKTWQGLLRLEENREINAGSEIYGKPLVDLLISYFLLAGIGEIYISCPETDRDYIARRMGDGSNLGITLRFLSCGESLPPQEGNTMVVYDNPFVYGSYLTRCFQRAMSRQSGISMLTIGKADTDGPALMLNSRSKRIQGKEDGGMRQSHVPILFFPRRWFRQIGEIEQLQSSVPMYGEPLDNGVIEYLIKDKDALNDTACFFRYVKSRMGKDLYDIWEIAKNRRFHVREKTED